MTGMRDFTDIKTAIINISSKFKKVGGNMNILERHSRSLEDSNQTCRDEKYNAWDEEQIRY